MPRSVIITTPMPTLQEFGRRLGISKRRQQSLLRLMERDGKPAHAVKNRDGDASQDSKSKTRVSRSAK